MALRSQRVSLRSEVGNRIAFSPVYPIRPNNILASESRKDAQIQRKPSRGGYDSPSLTHMATSTFVPVLFPVLVSQSTFFFI